MNRTLATLTTTAVVLGSLQIAHAEPEAPRSAPEATWLSVGGVAVSGIAVATGVAMGGGAGAGIAVIGASSLLITPSLGHFYSGSYATTGLITRLAGTAAMGVGVLLLLGSWGGYHDSHDSGGEAAGVMVLGAGGVAFVTGAAIDIARAGDAASAWNAKHRFSIAPTAIATPSGTTAGLGLGGRF